MLPPIGVAITWVVGSSILIANGALWAISPMLFVRVCRHFAPQDSYVASPEWEKTVITPSGRIVGVIFFLSGLGGLCLLASKLFHVF